MTICAIIPSHNHFRQLDAIVRTLLKEGLAIYIIDDGSTEPARSIISGMNNVLSRVCVHRLDTNQGKGDAVITGLQLAIKDGFTHALQVDADGQHDLSGLHQFLALSKQHPEAIICGKPHYDSSAPLGRKIGRWITHVWVWIETLSFRITDSMCGFRIYPLASVQSLIEQDKIGSRMDFDTDIIVRLFWRGVTPIMKPVRVVYPFENTSNFDILRDNWLITKMHTRLVLTMLRHLPKILAHRPPQYKEPRHWPALCERGAYWGMKFCAIVCCFLGRRGQRILLAPIVLYFYATGAVQRLASRDYLTRVLHRTPTWRDGYKHFMNFGIRALDVFMAWTGQLPKDILQSSDQNMTLPSSNGGQGGIIVVSHLGNVELVRAMLDEATQVRLTVLVHTLHAVNYNRILNEGSGNAGMNILQVTEIGPETIIDLKQRVEQGGWIVIAGDRVPVINNGNSVSVPFLGSDASFPQGPWVLAALLGCPVMLLFCIYDNGQYRLTMEHFADRISLPRADRQKSVREHVQRYAERLEHYCAKAPFQWYNFFDFWSHA